ncbi:MAG: tail fiber domain-containing protein [Dyadobacter sp.]|uniref:tail fiber domain-containing protein n=1 Tax=Dyadobacter sp. TaxID=1914288 RepID=UPI0032678A89
MKTNHVLIFAIHILLTVTVQRSFAQKNYFAGANAGASNSTGIHNAFVGIDAGMANTTGEQNTFIGHRSGRSTIDGSYNTFLGSYAGDFNASGANNVFIGNSAGKANTSGSHNIFIGSSAGYSNTEGVINVFVGTSAGRANTTGGWNTFLGMSAGRLNTTGYNNSFIGTEAGSKNTTGYDNAFLGVQAGIANTTGHSNLFLGTHAGSRNTIGIDNIIIGLRAGEIHTEGNSNIFLGNYAGASTYFKPVNSGPLTNAVAIGFRAQVTVNNGFVLGSINGINGAKADANVGIGTTSPAYRLHLGSGEAAKPGSSAWVVASDSRLKQNVTSFTDGLDVIKQIKPVRFNYNGLAGMPKNKQYVGVIAQEMEKIAPYTIGRFTSQDSTGQKADYLDYDAGALPYMLVNAVREMDDKYARQLADKEATIVNLESRISQLEQLIGKSAVAFNTEEAAFARLSQNEPNPTGGLTVVRYHIPSEATTAQLRLFSLNGQQVQQVDIRDKGEGNLTLNTSLLPSGVYVYHLLINGRSVATKKLVIAK